LTNSRVSWKRLKRFRTEIKAVPSDRVNPVGLRNTAELIGSHWCADLGPRLKTTEGCEAGLTEKYTPHFERLIKLSASNNLKSSYMSLLDAVTKGFRKDFILPVQQNKVVFSSTPRLFDELLKKIASSDEGDYFKEALSCAKAGYLRAATVLVWCTAIDRIHRKIAEIGLSKFNVTAAY
jgi:hypothetical protein